MADVRLPHLYSIAMLRRARRLLPAAFWNIFALFAIGCAVLPTAAPAFAQDRLLTTVPVDVSAFAISQNDRLVYAVPHLKGIRRTIIERDEIWIADFRGKAKPIVLPDKFMPVPPPVSYVVKKLAWSPDGRDIAVSMVMFTPTAEPPPRETEKQLQHRQHREQKEEEHAPKISVPPDGAQVVALFDDDGHEIRVSGSNTRFLEKATDGAWLADGQTVVYLTGIGPYKIARVTPATGKTTILFAGQAFDNVVFDPARNQAFAIGSSLSISGKPQLVRLDLIHEIVEPIAPVPVFQGGLTVSSNGQQVGYYVDGDTIEIHNLANPRVPIRVQTGPGKFEFGHEGDRILFKRGSLGDSGDLIWVGLHDNSWVPILHDLEFHEFALAPDGSAIVVMEPGKGELKVYEY
ncbi:MAG TPA: hypothetical protein VMF66_17740 [Candidatus Acidoferrum sp.]|nr:hypothetical protein [Candidatus Acidoferrum sp.]